MKNIQEQLACAKRELELRRRVYPKWVSVKKMTQEKADAEIACMEAIVCTLDRQAALAAVTEEMLGNEKFS